MMIFATYDTEDEPQVRMAFISKHMDGTLYADWDKWVDYVDENKKEGWVVKGNWVTDDLREYIDYIQTCNNSSTLIILNFLDYVRTHETH